MKRGAPIRRTRMNRISKKRRASGQYTKADTVYQAVDRRSRGRCEVVLEGFRCARHATDHHHTKKPRTKWHAPEWVIHVCRRMHEQVELPAAQGKLLIEPRGDGTFECRLVTMLSRPHSGDVA